MCNTVVNTDTFVSHLHKETVLNLLAEHWDEFTGLMAGSYKKTDCFPDWFYQFTHRLDECIKAAASTDTASQQAAHHTGLLEKACIMHTTKLKKLHADRAIIMEDGLFVVQSQPPSSDLDSGFQNLVDSVL